MFAMHTPGLLTALLKIPPTECYSLLAQWSSGKDLLGVGVGERPRVRLRDTTFFLRRADMETKDENIVAVSEALFIFTRKEKDIGCAVGDTLAEK
ncbi:hypothetical protein BHYA_0239g00130 [Botrytis hyacinthi]|uniref:Uncharacterized protein n=1 Tax=Botrytis hyacinthi TaxID=278943 RepID=A0A4Z1GHW7_9HELO|nr:hypothetical protein BHYA_0239g00130 [Botrytis hyacinthi]